MTRRSAFITIGAGLLAMRASVTAQSNRAAACDANRRSASLDLTLTDLSDRQIDLRAYEGKVLLLNFFATWCAPCRIEIPGFVDLYAKYHFRGLEVIGIAVDEPASIVEPYVHDMKVNYPIFITGGGPDIQEIYELRGLPTTIIIDRDGTICKEHLGFTPKQTFEASVRLLL